MNPAESARPIDQQSRGSLEDQILPPAAAAAAQAAPGSKKRNLSSESLEAPSVFSVASHGARKRLHLPAYDRAIEDAAATRQDLAENVGLYGDSSSVAIVRTFGNFLRQQPQSPLDGYFDPFRTLPTELPSALAAECLQYGKLCGF